MTQEVKVSEIQHGTMHIVRKCRIVTYLMGKNEHGREEIIAEVPERLADNLLKQIADAQNGPDLSRYCDRTES
jgi:hypothetical protein